ncbi:TlpA disulfide reductase family protein [Micromonospora soli]|uniref:TlpA disulfide reductase family protein n=1 Tax=Micromonospora sp. NBRC 110009 TaxID=3061627 RepID=UPI00267297B6|nr:TlpA disulfide reductase family protein [Micromonospora sp. NBRC 110009]WKU01744.1 TlpA disulfide reductase family protein [Micromonospora sp. NBRC 110009]
MPYLVTGVVLASALGILNLLLSLAVIRRLREHTELLAAAGDEPGIIAAGQVPGEFTATDLDGGRLRRVDLTGEVLVGFFSTNCPACTEALPRFVTWAAAFPGGRRQVLAVVSSDEPTGGGLSATLTGVARVIVEEPDGALATAFRATASPGWCILDATGAVRDSGTGVRRLPAPVAA